MEIRPTTVIQYGFSKLILQRPGSKANRIGSAVSKMTIEAKRHNKEKIQIFCSHQRIKQKVRSGCFFLEGNIKPSGILLDVEFNLIKYIVSAV